MERQLHSVPSERTLQNLNGMLESNLSMTVLSQSLRGLSMPYERETKSQEDTIFELFKIPGKNEASIGRLLTVLKSFGLRQDDPRLKPMMKKLRAIEKEEEEKTNEAVEPKHWKLDMDQFKECVGYSVDLISQALQNNLVIPGWISFVDSIRQIYLQCLEITDGNVATYIPQLARQSPNKWGVSICTVDGQRVSFGDSKTPFCVQSVSKAFNYAIAASDLGADMVHSYVGQEPSGRLFNDICLDTKNKPHNPMVNSGAIIVTSLIKNKVNMADRFDYVLNQYRKIAGGEYIGFNNATFLSERATADRNYALSYYMKEKKCFPPETTSLTDALDFYFQLCSIEGTCESLSVMAATLANGGVCPITNEKCIDSHPCRDVLSLMYSCGMYDASGKFSFSV
uniref:glutaminase n=1 Tax=Heterorhabditis bacteriophora TaxID=37862 RepID=A0A1I7XPJ9_HETBA